MCTQLQTHIKVNRHVCISRITIGKAVHESQSLRVICPSHPWERSEDSDFTDPMFFGSQSHLDPAQQVKFTSDPPCCHCLFGATIVFQAHQHVPARCMPHRHLSSPHSPALPLMLHHHPLPCHHRHLAFKFHFFATTFKAVQRIDPQRSLKLGGSRIRYFRVQIKINKK